MAQRVLILSATGAAFKDEIPKINKLQLIGVSGIYDMESSLNQMIHSTMSLDSLTVKIIIYQKIIFFLEISTT